MLALYVVLLQALSPAGQAVEQGLRTDTAKYAPYRALQAEQERTRSALAKALWEPHPDLPRIRELEADYKRIGEEMRREGRKNELAFLDQLSPADQITYFRRLYSFPVPPPLVVKPNP